MVVRTGQNFLTFTVPQIGADLGNLILTLVTYPLFVLYDTSIFAFT